MLVAPPGSSGWSTKPPSFCSMKPTQEAKREVSLGGALRLTAPAAAAASTRWTEMASSARARAVSTLCWYSKAAASLLRDPCDEPSQKLTTVANAAVSAPKVMLNSWALSYLSGFGLTTM